ncbi:MAG: hypothetical protein IJ939_00775, partial [Clostridia bacterium]|nr:hypothetical protein [Clostridia bacterium]
MSLKNYKEIDTNKVEMNIVIAKDVFENAVNAVFKRNAKQISIPGFQRLQKDSIIWKQLGGNMRHLWFGILACAAMLVACGDDGSDFSTRPSDDSSSSRAKSSSSAKSSDSVVGCKTEKEDNCEYSELADDRDGQTYKTVKIGDQWWMAENLNYETDSSFCYKDSAEFCEKYGRLYTWDAVVDVCPDGWHLPSKAEWETLITAVGGRATAGKMLKSTS